MLQVTPLQVISILNKASADDTIVDVFTHGGCWQLYRLLKTIFPEAEPYYDVVAGHVYTKIDNAFYDILGKHATVDAVPIDEVYNDFEQKAETWQYTRPHQSIH